MKKMILLALAAIALYPANVSAQEVETEASGVEAYVSGTLLSHYLWRGTDMCGLCIQPEAGLSWRRLSLVASGNAGFQKDDIQEIDITLGYTIKGFNIGITDYWTTGKDSENRYFFYKDGLTPHQFEANIGYSCRYFSLQAYTMFWGDDYKINGDRAYSTYVELSVPFHLAGLNWDLRAGVTPMESAGYTTTRTVSGLIRDITVTDNHYYYGEGFTCNMASLRATKEFQLNEHLKMPVFAELNANPYLQKAYFLMGIGLVTF